MNNRRTYLWLISAIILFAASHIYLSWRGRPAHALITRTALLTTAPSEIAALSIETPETPKPLSFIKRTQWEMTSPFLASVERAQVDSLLDAFLNSFVQATFDEHELLRLGKSRIDFGLAQPRANVKLENAAGTETAYQFGALTPSKRGIYVAVEGEDAIYVVDSRVWQYVARPLADYRKKTLFPEDIVERVQSFDIREGQRAFSRYVRKEGVWSQAGANAPTEGRVSNSRVEQFLKALATAQTESFVWPMGSSNESSIATSSLLAGYGLDAESAVTVTLKSSNGTDDQISFGSSAASNLVYALVQNASAIVRVPADLLKLADPANFTDARLFPYAAEAVTSLHLEDAGVGYSLAKTPSGEWTMSAPVVAPAEKETVETLLDNLLALKVPLAGSTNEPPLSAAVGTQKGRSPLTKVPRERVLANVALENLRSREMLAVPAAEISRLVLTKAGEAKPLAVVYNSERREWLIEPPLAGEATQVDIPAVAAILAQVQSLKAQRIVKLKVAPADLRLYGLENPRLTLSIDSTQAGAVRRNILIGDAVEGGAYATIGAADAVFVLPARALQAFSASLIKPLER